MPVLNRFKVFAKQHPPSFSQRELMLDGFFYGGGSVSEKQLVVHRAAIAFSSLSLSAPDFTCCSTKKKSTDGELGGHKEQPAKTVGLSLASKNNTQ